MHKTLKRAPDTHLNRNKRNRRERHGIAHRRRDHGHAIGELHEQVVRHAVVD